MDIMDIMGLEENTNLFFNIQGKNAGNNKKNNFY